MQCNFSLEGRFKQLSLQEFYKSLDKARYPMLRSQAKRMMCQFGSTYICEQVFSFLNLNMNKLRKKLTDDNLRDTIRIATTKVIPNLK